MRYSPNPEHPPCPRVHCGGCSLRPCQALQTSQCKFNVCGVAYGWSWCCKTMLVVQRRGLWPSIAHLPTVVLPVFLLSPHISIDLLVMLTNGSILHWCLLCAGATIYWFHKENRIGACSAQGSPFIDSTKKSHWCLLCAGATIYWFQKKLHPCLLCSEATISIQEISLPSVGKASIQWYWPGHKLWTDNSLMCILIHTNSFAISSEMCVCMYIYVWA